jgi:aryl-alcohol dehydrogenase-like predicted oxidoreductase
VVEAVEGSLRRLHTDYVDLYQMHRPHDEADLGETLSALTDLVRAGKVRAIGTSTFPPSLLVEAARVATELGLQRFATEQPPYSALARGVEREVLPVAGDLGLGVAVWAPLNGGWLSGRYRRGEVPPPDSRARREPDHFDWELPVAKVKLDAVAALEEVAAAVGLSLVHLALGFVLSHPSVTTAIIGPRTPEQLEAMLDLPVDRLTGATLDRIDAIVAPGVDLNPADRGHVPAALADPRLRRR